ncbi:Hypothetical protein A7982_06409 [Minicystis rosea]|nr:Hypothetical protein A7982_06409 [Minicystis rosea]
MLDRLDSLPDGDDEARDASWGIDPRHPLLPDAHNYDLLEFNLCLAPADGGEPYVDLVLASASRRVVLRFWSPRQLEIQEGGPSTFGMEILDLSARGLDGISVRVDDYELSGGAVRFVARTLEILADEQLDSSGRAQVEERLNPR